MYTPIIRINLLTSEKELLNPQQQVSLYPNPVEGTLIIQSDLLKADQTHVQIQDLTGKQWMLLQCNSQQDATLALDCAGLPAGVYIVTIQSKNGQILHQKMVKN